MRLDSQVSASLPCVVLVGEVRDLAGDGLLHGNERSLLVLRAGNSDTVALTGSRPASLVDVDVLTTASS